MGIGGGMYHNQVVLEDGVWRLWSVTIDEHYYSSPYEGGWSAASAAAPRQGADRAPRRDEGRRRRGAWTAAAGARASNGAGERLSARHSSDKLGERERGFRGGTGETIIWPGILPMWFHYKNPVSGRVPENYWPDCVPCVAVSGDQHEEPRLPAATVLTGC